MTENKPVDNVLETLAFKAKKKIQGIPVDTLMAMQNSFGAKSEIQKAYFQANLNVTKIYCTIKAMLGEKTALDAVTPTENDQK